MTLTTMMAALLVLQTASDPLLARLEGQWKGEGTVLGQASTIEMAWSWALDRQFLELTFRNDMQGPAGARRFEGRAFYRTVKAGKYAGFWIDNSGAIRPLDADGDAGTLTARWGTDETERGETTYRLADDGRLEVTDRVRQRDGTWRVFGQSVLMKR